MRRCILHIGVPKTASTTIQRSLRRNRERLESVGIVYRTSADGEQQLAKHQALAVQLRGDRKRKLAGLDLDELGDLLQVTECDTVVLSSEAFSDAEVKGEKVAELLGYVRDHGFEPVVIVYVRALAPLIQSRYGQNVKTMGFGGSFAEYVGRELENHDWSYSKRLEPWTGQSGLDFRAIPFVAENTGPDIAAKLLKLGGAPAEQVNAASMEHVGAVNEAPGPMAVAAFRKLRAARPGIKKAWRSTPLSKVAIKDAKTRGWFDEKFVGLTPELASAIEERFGADNEAFARRYWGRGWRETFAADYSRAWTPNELDLDALAADVKEELDQFVDAQLSVEPPERRRPRRFRD